MSKFQNLGRGVLGATVLTLCVMTVGAYLSGARILFNVSGSLPYHLFFAVRNSEIICGQKSIGFFQLNVENPYWDFGTVFAKRFVGCPGDVLTTKGREFYINGSCVGVASETDSRGYLVKSFKFSGEIPKNTYFVLGDGKDSYDSRYWGFVKKSWIVGRGFPLF